VTGSESSNNFFVVEKSADGITFNDLEFLNVQDIPRNSAILKS
jgi:hypothetical protein